jgi:hypothetical protein
MQRSLPPRRVERFLTALVGGGASALARRVPLRGGRNARPVSSGPSGRPGVKVERPQAAQRPGPSQLAGVGGRGRTTLTPAPIGPGGIPAG